MSDNIYVINCSMEAANAMSSWSGALHFMEDKMNEFLKLLQSQIETAEQIGNKIENGEEYMEDIRAYLPSLNQTVTSIFQIAQEPGSGLEINAEFVLQVLNDILYGIEHRDSVFLLDVLRYGLLEIYYYLAEELQSGGEHE